MSIITGRGDCGGTDLLFGKRIEKTSLRIGVLGTIDELNAALGLARVAGKDEEVLRVIDGLQARLVGLMGELACLPEDSARYAAQFGAMTSDEVTVLEELAKNLESRGVKFTDWARPGAEGSMAKAGLDFARTIARRAEREVWLLHESGEPASEPVRLFFNRVSDLLWILARVGNQ
jgi:cob(I)alamin adenosyltransferase